MVGTPRLGGSPAPEDEPGRPVAGEGDEIPANSESQSCELEAAAVLPVAVGACMLGSVRGADGDESPKL